MRKKRQDNRQTAGLVCFVNQTPDEMLVSAMHAIKNANRNQRRLR
jgi:hypothetical protein